MIYHFTLGKEYGVIFGSQFNSSPWWMYVITVFFGIMALLFFGSGKVISCTLNKRIGYMATYTT